MTKEVKRISLYIFLLPILMTIFSVMVSYTSVALFLKDYFHKQQIQIQKEFFKDLKIKTKNRVEIAYIVKIIILLGKVLNLKIAAEGVESENQKEFLLIEGVDILQGYLYSSPISADEFKEKFLKV